jgi:hypothetical protein
MSDLSEGARQFLHWIDLPPGTSYVRFGEVAHLMALALWPDGGFPYGGARVNLDDELVQAVDAGRLPVCDPLTLGPHTFPQGDALQDALVKVTALRSYVAQRDIGIRSSGHSLTDIAKEAAMREWPPIADERDLRSDVRDSMRADEERQSLARLRDGLKQGRFKAVHQSTGASFDPVSSDAEDAQWMLDDVQREEALQLLGQLVRTHDTTSGRKLVALQSRQAHERERAAADKANVEGGFLLHEAASAIAAQQGEGGRWAKALWERMKEAADRSESDPNRLCVRDGTTGLVASQRTPRSRVTPEDVNAWLQVQDAPFRWSAGTQIAPAASAAVAASVVEPMRSTVHRLATRRNSLLPVIEQAQKLAGNPWDVAAVWVQLEKSARATDPPAPLCGVNSGGIQWRDGGRIATFTRKALSDRLRRARAAVAR